jgi:hypothetical protein
MCPEKLIKSAMTTPYAQQKYFNTGFNKFVTNNVTPEQQWEKLACIRKRVSGLKQPGERVPGKDRASMEY